MKNQDELMKEASGQEKAASAPQAEEKPAMADGKTMLLFGGMMAVCCAFPLLLASGLSLAWLTESPAVAGGVAAIAALFAWRLSRKGSACGHTKQGTEKKVIPIDQA
jgi:hypothetical protein